MAEKAGVWRPASSSSSPEQLLQGAPFRISSSASASKEQLLMQVGSLSSGKLPGPAPRTRYTRSSAPTPCWLSGWCAVLGLVHTV